MSSPEQQRAQRRRLGWALAVAGFVLLGLGAVQSNRGLVGASPVADPASGRTFRVDGGAKHPWTLWVDEAHYHQVQDFGARSGWGLAALALGLILVFRYQRRPADPGKVSVEHLGGGL